MCCRILENWYKWRFMRIRTAVTFILLGITLGNLVGLTLVLDTALKNFFVRDAINNLQQQANVFASGAKSEWNNQATIRQRAKITAQQGQLHVIVVNSKGEKLALGTGVSQATSIEIPPEVLSKTLAGYPQQGRFRVAIDTQYPWWLYGTAPIRQGNNAQLQGAVYIAMPMRRPRQFSQQVEGVVITMALFVTAVTAGAGLWLSRSFTKPLKRLQLQAERLGVGDYSARSNLKGLGELAQLSHLLDEMAAKLATTLEALKAQEVSRRELVANVSHDLRTPLASLRVELEAILDGVVSGEKATEYLRRACRETDYLARLVEQLLWLARADAGQLVVNLQTVSALAIAQECISRMELAAEAVNIKLRLKSVSQVPMVWVDPELTGQVVLNLLDNAIKYAPNSEVISLEILPIVEQNHKYYVPLQVRDFGPGMEPEVVQRAPERFYRSLEARPKGGLGLGLAIAQQVCQLQGGSLQIESQPALGTSVKLLLPATDCGS
jgi:signal transduction histidine kinase